MYQHLNTVRGGSGPRVLTVIITSLVGTHHAHGVNNEWKQLSGWIFFKGDDDVLGTKLTSITTIQ